MASTSEYERRDPLLPPRHLWTLDLAQVDPQDWLGAGDSGVVVLVVHDDGRHEAFTAGEMPSGLSVEVHRREMMYSTYILLRFGREA